MFLSYIDSASGSLVAQVAVAGFAGAAVAAKLTWRRATGRLRRGRGAEGSGAAPGTETHAS